ncbi:MAG TPA: anaerobic sulfatase maturase [Candidatus Avoscillospira stercorigallinarum]|uniref:Anaerobic sulfatase maturase n=1 Tax=Candidatus Avoscillospira stercorigallinarum TaxID=2840708 RepID=A0A9D1CNK5_9FIRM|nr:anaerobic sulfatase maturase [Candidatus Avoscillospira stercorigallinarum]
MEFRSYLIKPASDLCNMRCRYCFYHDVAQNRTVQHMGRMTEAVADALIAGAFDGAARDTTISFAFQGGEPTVRGLPYFRHFVEEVRRVNTRRLPAHFAIQTNGLALDEDWCRFLAENRFLVGVSIDGDKALHDAHRVDAQGDGTWNRVTANLRLLQKAGAEVNALCVVTRQCARSSQKVYHALQKLGVRYHQYIACLDPLEAQRGSLPFSLTPDAYGKFLCGLFDAWYRDWKAGTYTSIRYFEDLVHLLLGEPASTCATCGNCGAYCVAEGDGSVYPCDFFVLDQWRMGSVTEDGYDALLQAPAARRFLARGQERPLECQSCSYLRLCGGGCKRDWVEADGAVHNYFCASFRALLSYALPRLTEIARAEAAARGR